MMFNQVGRGEKRNHESDSESESEDEQGQRYFEREPKVQYNSEKFGMTATDHRVRFNNVIAHRDLLEAYSQGVFVHPFIILVGIILDMIIYIITRSILAQ